MAEELQASSSETPSASLSRESYVYLALRVAEQMVRRRHPALRVTIPVRPSLPELLETCSKALSSDTLPVVVPAVTSHSEERRQALQKLARETHEAMKEREANGAGVSGRAILTHGLLEHAGPPKPLTPSQRERLKERFADILYPSQSGPSPLLLPLYPSLKSNLPVVTCNIMISAVDHEDQMPQESISQVSAIWDTGADLTVITDDILSSDFRKFVQKADVHDPYRHEGTARVQIACTVEFSNTLLTIETLAVVQPLSSAPDGFSGVILGQRGLIDSLRNESVPRNIAVAEDPTLSENCWGRFDLKSYSPVYGEVQHF